MKKYVGIIIEQADLSRLISAAGRIRTAEIAHITNARPQAATRGRADYSGPIRADQGNRGEHYINGGGR